MKEEWQKQMNISLQKCFSNKTVWEKTSPWLLKFKVLSPKEKNSSELLVIRFFKNQGSAFYQDVVVSNKMWVIFVLILHFLKNTFSSNP